MTPRTVLRRANAALMLALLAACGDDGGDPGAFTMTTATNAITIAPAANAIVEVTITRTGSFTGPVEITAEGLPSGLTATVSAPSIIALGVTRSVVTVSAPAGTAAGSGTFTIRGRAPGLADQTATINVTITPTPTFNLTVAPTTLNVLQGTVGTATVTVNRLGGFTGALEITPEGVPAGVTVTSASVPANGTTATFTVTVANNATLGNTPITLRARSPGQLDYTTTIPLVVAGYSMTVAPATVNLLPGTPQDLIVTITRTGGYAGQVDLTVEGLPAGVTATSSSTTGNRDTLTLTATTAAELRTTNLTVRGKATGLLDRTATVALSITGFGITVTPSQLTVPQGSTGTLEVAIARSGGYAGAVTLAVEGLPAGVTATIPAATTGNSATITLTAEKTATISLGDITVRATGPDVIERTRTVALRINPEVGFTISAPNVVRVEQGTSEPFTVNVNRTGNFAGEVTISVAGLPAGVTAPTVTTTGNTATVTLTAEAAAAVATGTATITGSAPGIPDQPWSTRVEVTPTGEGTRIRSGVPVTGLSGALDSESIFRIWVPAGATQLLVRTTGATSDLDLYVSRNGIPGDVPIVCRAETASGNETCTINNPASGNWYILLYGYEPYSGVTLTATISGVENPGLPAAAARARTVTLTPTVVAEPTRGPSRLRKAQ